MKTGTVDLKLQDGTPIKIKGSADFVAAVTAVILEVGKGRSSDRAQVGKPEPIFGENRVGSNWAELILKGLPSMTKRERIELNFC
jgi:hypothetical protein